MALKVEYFSNLTTGNTVTVTEIQVDTVVVVRNGVVQLPLVHYNLSGQDYVFIVDFGISVGAAGSESVAVMYNSADTTDAINDSVTRIVNTQISSTVSTNDIVCNVGVTTYALASPPATGILVFNTDGTYTFTPQLNFVGTETFQYRILCDGVVADTATVSFVYTSYLANAEPDSYTTYKNLPVGAVVIGNDTICNNGNTYYDVVPLSEVGGTVVMSQGGAFLFSPTLNSLTTGSFQYRIRCGVDFATSVVTDTAMVAIQVVGANLTDDSFTTTVNRAVTGSVGFNDVISC